MFCDKSLYKNDDKYFEKNVFLIGDLNSDFKYYLCLEQNSTYKIDTTTEFVADTLQYHCPINWLDYRKHLFLQEVFLHLYHLELSPYKIVFALDHL